MAIHKGLTLPAILIYNLIARMHCCLHVFEDNLVCTITELVGTNDNLAALHQKKSLVGTHRIQWSTIEGRAVK